MGWTKKMIDRDWEQIEYILEEASRYNLRHEVEQSAKRFIENDPDLNVVEAYEMAYAEWIR